MELIACNYGLSSLRISPISVIISHTSLCSLTALEWLRRMSDSVDIPHLVKEMILI